jgi:hypothetical protein
MVVCLEKTFKLLQFVFVVKNLDLGLFCPQNGIIGRIFKKPISIMVSHYKVHDQGLYGNELLQIIYHRLAKLDNFLN